MLLKTLFGWVITCVIVGCTTAILTLQGIHAPKLFANNTEIIYINNTLSSEISSATWNGFLIPTRDAHH